MIFPVFLERGEVVRVFDGVQVGEYGGRNSSVAPVWWMRCAVSGALCKAALSMMTRCSGVRRGQSLVLSQELNRRIARAFE